MLALIGMQQRPWLLVAAGLLLVPMCFLSFSFLFFPLVVPRRCSSPTPSSGRGASLIPSGSAAVRSSAAVFVVAAVLSLFAHQDPVGSEHFDAVGYHQRRDHDGRGPHVDRLPGRGPRRRGVDAPRRNAAVSA